MVEHDGRTYWLIMQRGAKRPISVGSVIFEDRALAEQAFEWCARVEPLLARLRESFGDHEEEKFLTLIHTLIWILKNRPDATPEWIRDAIRHVAEKFDIDLNVELTEQTSGKSDVLQP